VYDSVRSEDLRRYWLGDETVKLLPTNPILYVSPETHAWLTELWGAPGSRLIQVSAAETIPTALWKSRTKALAILPIEQLTPSLKVLAVDAFEPLSPKLNRAAYPLKQSTSSTTGRLTNYDPTKSTVLVMTGVTALTRATAYQMEKTGIELPARDILPFLADAHIVHTSNEVSFAENCPDPSPYGNTTFCSKDEYFDLLKAINLRVVELTGNHGNDYGRGAFLRSLDLYEKAGIIPFGGGRTLAEAQAAVTVVHHGNAFAFIGCNPVGPAYAWAKKDQAGAATCDLPYLKTEIQRLKAAGYIVIMTIQYQEYYFYGTTGSQAEFFGQFADWGADLVMGSQAHTPQGFALTGNTFIHYGIGNLFFDQMDYINTRQMFIDKLYFYEGRLISVGLFTGLLEDFSRPRPMTDKERGEFLNTIFKVSGW
jgi:poly-gamma-glutamate synthesis protein (capsule biosynthesis protein)